MALEKLHMYMKDVESRSLFLMLYKSQLKMDQNINVRTELSSCWKKIHAEYFKILVQALVS